MKTLHTRWGDVPPYSTAIDQAGVVWQVSEVLVNSDGFVVFRAGHTALSFRCADPVVLLIPGEMDAVINLMHAGFEVTP